MQKHRIYTNIGRDQKINVEINQGYDILEILSLKFTQKDIFASGNCSEYGVVVGRISANGGYGIPNARVSIFVPEEDIDEDDPVIHSLYPYKVIGDKNEDNYRYNLLPSRKQHPGHNPTGTFFDQQDILTREEVLEVFEKYYSYTVKTNSAGDFMIWGVPVGTQVLHIDIDLSDIGCFSFRPNDFLNKGYGIEQFESFYRFKASDDIDSLPQIVTFDKSIEVYPFWGNEELCEIGITRSDFDLSDRDVKIQPTSVILFSSATDETSHAIKRNGRIRKNSGYKCNLQTSEGKIEVVRFTGKSVIGSDGVTEYPELEYYNPTETINEDGVSMILLPMNLDYMFTNELGEQEITNDPNKGIPTGCVARFKFSLDFNSSKVKTASYLVPNIREFSPNPDGTARGYSDKSEYQESLLATYQFSDVFEDYLRVTSPSEEIELFSANYGDDVKEHKRNLILGGETPQDYFYRFVYGKVYAVSSFQGTHYENAIRDAFLGIKEIRPNIESDCASSTNYLPTNFAFRNRIKFNLILSEVILFLQYIFSIITIKFAEIIGKTAYNIGRDLQGIRILRRVGQKIEDFAYRTQERYTKELPLTIYPDCEECTSDDEAYTDEGVDITQYCRVGEVAMEIWTWTPHITVTGLHLFIRDSDAERWQQDRFSISTAPGSSLVDSLFPGEASVETEGNCEGNVGIAYTSLDSLHTEVLDDGYPRYAVELVSSGDTQIFDSFAAYLQPPTSETKSLYFTQTNDVYDGSPGYYMNISPSYWMDLTGMNLADQDGIDLLARSSPPFNTVVARIYDRSRSTEGTNISGSTVNIEAGCQKYDKLYNEIISRSYIWTTQSDFSYASRYPINPNIGIYVDDVEFAELEKEDTLNTHPFLVSTAAGNASTARMPLQVNFHQRGLFRQGIGMQYYDRKTKSGLTEFRDGLFTIIPVIRGKSYNLKVLLEWYRRKRIGLFFCGGVVNYSFIDNWLHGILYFFKFDERLRWDNEQIFDLNQRGSKFPRELVYYNVIDKTFYYRSTPYNMDDGFIGQRLGGIYGSYRQILHPTTFYDLGPRDEFISEICTDTRLDTSCSVIRDIGVSSYQDPGNVVEYAINYRLDTTNSKFDVNDFFSKRHLGTNIKIFDGDITQLMSINCETGIEAFDTDSSHYFMYNGEYMDPEDNRFGIFFKAGNLYGPTPIDFKLDYNGVYLRLCLNNRLGDNSQIVPFYLWDKRGPGFGNYGSTSDDQTWDRNAIASMPLQRIFSISGATSTQTNYVMPDGEEEYVLKPMTMTHDTFSVTGNTSDSLERFEVISLWPPDTTEGGAIQYVEGDLWLYVVTYDPNEYYAKDPWTGIVYVVVNKTWVAQPEWYISSTSGEQPETIRESFVPQTVLNYIGDKQVLSTPFLFYFGLKPGRTSLDLLIKYYGAKDVFTSEEDIECIISDAPVVTPTGAPPTPTPPVTLTPPITVTSTPTPTPTPESLYYYRLVKCVEGYSSGIYYYAQSIVGTHLNTGDGVWGSTAPNCTDHSHTDEYKNYAYVVIDDTTNEQEYIDAGYQNIGYVTVSELGGCMDCEGLIIAPPPPPPEYSQIYLVRNSDGASSTCNSSFFNAENVQTAYIFEPSITPSTSYNVYVDPPNWSIPFEPSGLYWGIVYDMSDPVVHYTVYVGDNGALSTWTECSPPSPTPPPVSASVSAVPDFSLSPMVMEWNWNEGSSSYSKISNITMNIYTEFSLWNSPSWITVQAWNPLHGGTWETLEKGVMHSYSQYNIIRVFPNAGNTDYTNREGIVEFSVDGLDVYSDPDSYINVLQDAQPVGVAYTWNNGLSNYGCELKYASDGGAYSDPSHGMTVGSNTFDISFWADCVEYPQYIEWSIIRVSPNPAGLAFGDANPTTGITLRAGHASTKSGTLADPIADGDIIRINIGILEA